MSNEHNGINITDFAKFLLEQQKTIKSFAGISMISELTKGIQQQNKFIKKLSEMSLPSELVIEMQQQKATLNPTFSAFDAITKSMKLQSKFVIPQTTFDAIISINKQHEIFLGEIRGIADIIKIQSPAITQINSLHYALGGISRQIAALAANQKNWTIIEDFDEVTKKALDFTETLSEEISEEHQIQFQVLLALVAKFFDKHKKLGISALLIIDIFLRFTDMHQYYDFLKDKPEPATKAYVNQISIKQDSILHYIDLINKQFKAADQYRITNQNCEVKLKPKNKTLVLGKLPKDIEVIVIQISHKWVYVSYFDPIDNLPQTGWIMKKYLSEPKKN